MKTEDPATIDLVHPGKHINIEIKGEASTHHLLPFVIICHFMSEGQNQDLNQVGYLRKKVLVKVNYPGKGKVGLKREGGEKGRGCQTPRGTGSWVQRTASPFPPLKPTHPPRGTLNISASFPR